MLSNLLDVEPVYVSVGEAALDGLIGFLVVFLGISILIGVVWLVGFIFKKIEGSKTGKKETISVSDPVVKAEIALASSESDEAELVAVITAAVAQFTASDETRSACEFTVRKIKRISKYNLRRNRNA